MQVVSGDYGKEKIHYEAPPFDTLEQQMNSFIEWFNDTSATLEKASLAHLCFRRLVQIIYGGNRAAHATTRPL